MGWMLAEARARPRRPAPVWPGPRGTGKWSLVVAVAEALDRTHVLRAADTIRRGSGHRRLVDSGRRFAP